MVAGPAIVSHGAFWTETWTVCVLVLSLLTYSGTLYGPPCTRVPKFAPIVPVVFAAAPPVVFPPPVVWVCPPGAGLLLPAPPFWPPCAPPFAGAMLGEDRATT